MNSDFVLSSDAPNWDYMGDAAFAEDGVWWFVEMNKAKVFTGDPGVGGFVKNIGTERFDFTAQLVAEDNTGFGGMALEIVAEEGGDVIPEPATLSLLGLGALALCRRRRPRA